MATELKIDITAEANEYLRELANELVEEVKMQLGRQQLYLTLNEVYEEFNCSRNTVNKWFQEYDLPRIVISGKIYVDINDLHDMFQKFKN